MRRSLLLLTLLLTSPALAQGASTSRAKFIADMDARFRAMDSDRNGQLSPVEIEASQRAEASAAASKRNATLFALLDADKDGKISLAELSTMDDRRKQMLEGADKNSDGFMDKSELMVAASTFMAQMRERGGKGGAGGPGGGGPGGGPAGGGE